MVAAAANDAHDIAARVVWIVLYIGLPVVGPERTVREMNVTPHVATNNRNRASNLDSRTTQRPGYAISLSRRWLVEKSFAWLKQTGPLRQAKLRGLGKVDWLLVFGCAAHNLLRLPKLFAVQQTPMFRAQAA